MYILRNLLNFKREIPEIYLPFRWALIGVLAIASIVGIADLLIAIRERHTDKDRATRRAIAGLFLIAGVVVFLLIVLG